MTAGTGRLCEGNTRRDGVPVPQSHSTDGRQPGHRRRISPWWWQQRCSFQSLPRDHRIQASMKLSKPVAVFHNLNLRAFLACTVRRNEEHVGAWEHLSPPP